MRNMIITILIVWLAIIGLASTSHAQMASRDEAMAVARNWIRTIIRHKGDWGGSRTAMASEIREFKRGERVLGYFCTVNPQGFIVISSHKALSPVKAYSAVSDLNPESDEGMADVIKIGMEGVLNRIEERVGRIESVQIEALEDILEIDYRYTWEELESGIIMDYQGGEPPLLSSAWHQRDPYNRLCPPGESCARTIVGCVATAAAQIMRYWNWPPFGEGGDNRDGEYVSYSDTYDWPNMLDEYEGTPWSYNPEGAAVAELCYEAGVAVDMEYGCNSSKADTYDMEEAYEKHFRYSTNCVKRDRNNYNAVEWFNLIKAQLNVNQPMQYKVSGHSIVCDGWQEIGSEPIRQYHMNYGWGGWVPNDPDWQGYTNSNTWYTLVDGLPGSDPGEEYMLKNIYPAPSLGKWLQGELQGEYKPPPFPYRYFNRVATGHDAIFYDGHYLQFLPRVRVICTSPKGGRIEFRGWSISNTYLFTRGDTSRGIRINSGHIYLYQNGSIKLY